MGEIDVVCLPQHLPAFIEVDLQNLQAGQSIHVSELTFPEGVKPVVHGDDNVVAAIALKKGGSDTAAEDETVAA
jgi:large subunit ribosomal protein L25